jgi:DNA repair exonuclease SbcCD nuclease subunit
MKILLLGDIHLMDKAPRNAADSYTQDILDILEHTAKLELELDCDAVIWAGDIFHHKQPSRTSHRLVLKAIEAVKRYRNLWIVTGNHDISNDQLSSVHEQQPLGVLFEAGAKELVGWHPELPVYGVPWQQRWGAEGVIDEVFADYRAEFQQLEPAAAPMQQESSLVVTHAALFPPAEKPNNWETTDPLDVAAAMGGAGYVYYGHIHEDHGFYEVEGVTFGNVGAISRGSLTEYNLERKIQVAIWSPEAGFEAIEVPQRPAAEVFKVEQAAAVKEVKLDLETFLSSVGSTQLQISSSDSVIQHLRELDLDEDIRRRAIELLELAG